MFEGITAHRLIGVGIVNVLPQEAGGFAVAAMLSHVRGQHLQPGVSTRHSRTTFEGLGGSDEGLTFDITTAGPEDEGKRILRFDCFYKNPHYHVGPSGGLDAAHKMKEEGVEDSVRWTLTQLKTRLPAMVKEAGYEEIAERIDQQAIADQLTRLEPEILAKY